MAVLKARREEGREDEEDCWGDGGGGRGQGAKKIVGKSNTSSSGVQIPTLTHSRPLNAATHNNSSFLIFLILWLASIGILNWYVKYKQLHCRSRFEKTKVDFVLVSAGTLDST
jgi:hypothetical protein